MGFRDDIAMVIGGLQHGLDFDTAFQIVTEAQNRRRENRPDVAALKATVAEQMLDPNVDPARLSAYAEMVAPTFNVGVNRADKIADSLPGMMGGWTEADSAAFMDPGNDYSPVNLIGRAIDSGQFDGPEGVPDRAAIRKTVAAQLGVTSTEKVGFDQTFDRAFDMLLLEKKPDVYTKYAENLTRDPRVPKDDSQGFIGDMTNALPGPLKAAGLLPLYGGVRAAARVAGYQGLPKAGYLGGNAIKGGARLARDLGKTGLSNLIQGTRFDPATQPYGQVGRVGKALSHLTKPAGVTGGEVDALNLLKGVRASVSTSAGIPSIPSFLYDPGFADNPQGAMERYRAQQEAEGEGSWWEQSGLYPLVDLVKRSVQG